MTDTHYKISKLGRLKKRSEFLHVRNGKYRAQGGVVIQARQSLKRAPDTPVRVGFTATKKIGNAVTRNRAKRRLRAAAHAILPTLGLAGHDYVFIARASTIERSHERLLDDCRKALLSLQPLLISAQRDSDSTAQ